MYRDAHDWEVEIGKCRPFKNLSFTIDFSANSKIIVEYENISENHVFGESLEVKGIKRSLPEFLELQLLLKSNLNVTFDIPLVFKNDCSSKMHLFISQATISHPLIFNSYVELIDTRLEISMPFKYHWNEHREWKINLISRTAELSFNRRFIDSIMDLISGFSMRKSELAATSALQFIPISYLFTISIDALEALLFANDMNVIGKENQNNLISLIAKENSFNMKLQFDSYEQTLSTVPYKLRFSDISVSSILFDSHTYKEYFPANTHIGTILSLDIDFLYSYKTPSSGPDKCDIDIKVNFYLTFRSMVLMDVLMAYF